MKMRLVGMIAGLLALSCVSAFAQAGSAGHPIVVRMKRGTDTVTLTGHLKQNRDCCAYRFKARAGQTLVWDLKGPAVRATMIYPDGHMDGPLPGTIALPADGTYVFAIRPNLMADGAFGPFILQLKIPPLAAADH
jgi:hypothetical protein